MSLDEIEMMRELVRELRDEHVRLKAEIDSLKDQLIWSRATHRDTIAKTFVALKSELEIISDET